MTMDRDKWLEALADFGAGPDVAAEYAALIERTRIFREVSQGRGLPVLLLSNDNRSNYSADIIEFPPV